MTHVGPFSGDLRKKTFRLSHCSYKARSTLATMSKQQATLLPVASTMLPFWATLSKQRSTLSKGRNFNAKLVRHCCRFCQQSRTLLRHCCWCGPSLSNHVRELCEVKRCTKTYFLDNNSMILSCPSHSHNIRNLAYPWGQRRIHKCGQLSDTNVGQEPWSLHTSLFRHQNSSKT